MKVKDIVKTLKGLDQEGTFLVSGDEELNRVFSKCQIGILDKKKYVIYGLDGSEIDEEDI